MADQDNHPKNTSVTRLKDVCNNVAPVTLGPQVLERVQDHIDNQRDQLVRASIARRGRLMAGFDLATLGFCAGGFLLTQPWLFFAGAAACAFISQWHNTDQHDDFKNNAIAARQIVNDRARYLIEKAAYDVQCDSYKAKKIEMMRLADRHLQQSGLLDEDTLPMLALITPDMLGDASDALAITVMQVRGALNYNDSPDLPAEKRPMSFGRMAAEYKMAVNPQCDEHRHLLRQQLDRCRYAITEDRDPLPEDCPKPDLDHLFDAQTLKAVEALSKKTNFLKKAMEDMMPARAARKHLAHIETIKSYHLPDNISVEVPALRPPEDVCRRVARYERENEPLDLPAIRGWGGKTGLPGVAPRLLP